MRPIWVFYVLLAAVFIVGLLAGLRRSGPRSWPLQGKRVRDILSQPVVTVREDATLEEAARLMLDRSIGCVVVVNGRGELTGILTESDFTGRERVILAGRLKGPEVFGEWISQEEGVEEIHEQARGRQVKDVMTRAVVTVSADEPVTQVVLQMIEHDLHRIPVVRDKVPVGIVTRRNLLRLMAPDAEQ